MAECAFWFKSQGTEKFDFSPKGLRTVKIFRYEKSDYC